MTRSVSTRPVRKATQKSRAPARSRRARNSNRSTGNVTLGDVAKLAGVSPITVSRVLNRPEQVIARTGYVPNLLAGGLASRRSRLVAAIVPSITNSMFVETVQSLTDRLWEAGYQMVLGLSGYPASREEALLAAILSRRPDAVFLTGISHSAESRRRLLAARIPIIEVWDLTPTPIDMCIGFSHEKVGQAVAEYLVGKGHRRFGLIWADDDRATMRRQGFISVLATHGITDAQTMMVPAPSTLRLGREGLARLLGSGDGPDAVFCSSDTLAHGVLAEAQTRGLSVPRQLSVVGFGDLDFAAHTYPALSTVRIDRPAIGRQAAEALLARIDGRAVEKKVVDIGFQLIERASG
jgi:LacI family transcriptional regulator, gluconate utilization system Gnt-I transcriptional repressor